MQTLRDPDALGLIVSLETGLGFEASSRKDIDGRQIFSLKPEGHSPAHKFGVDVGIEWWRLELNFVPGKFAGKLLQAMSEADTSGRAVFKSVLGDCERQGAKVILKLNEKAHRYDDESIWDVTWRRLSFQLSKGNLELGTEDGNPDFEIVRSWAVRFAAAVVSLLPLEEYEAEELDGYPEGAMHKVEVNRYERDRRNRSAALAIHGNACLVCSMDFGRTYGPDAEGYIDVHHVVPVSELGSD